MSLKRDGRGSLDYREGYTRSRAWFMRRDAFLDMVLERDGFIACACCLDVRQKENIQVHHLDYTGVVQLESGRWVAREADDDLLPMCEWCHEEVHKVMDADMGWSQWSRRDATREIVARIQRRLAAAGVAALGERVAQ